MSVELSVKAGDIHQLTDWMNKATPEEAIKILQNNGISAETRINYDDKVSRYLNESDSTDIDISEIEIPLKDRTDPKPVPEMEWT